MQTRTPATRLAEIDRERIVSFHLSRSDRDRVVIVRGEGCRVWDADGAEYLDALAGGMLTQVGHGRTEIAEAVAAQLRRLQFFPRVGEFTNERAVELAVRLTDLAPAHLTQVFLASGGSEANDAAIKMARLYHHRRGETGRTWILSRQGAYHGATYGGCSVTGMPVFHEGVGPMLPHIAHLTPPWPYRRELYGGQDPTEFLVGELEATIQRIGPDRVAAMIGEPVMGVGGVLVPPQDYWPRVREILDRHGILLILDEVITAFGRTGHWFAAERFGVRPDLVTIAKGVTSGYLPLGAVLVSGDVAEVLGREHGFPMAYTYSGHPAVCAAALANLDIIQHEGLLARAAATGAVLDRELRAQLGELPVVGEVRSVGMLCGVELVADTETRAPLPTPDPLLSAVIRQETRVLVRTIGHHLLLCPPLVMRNDEARRVVDGVRGVLERTRPDGTIA